MRKWTIWNAISILGAAVFCAAIVALTLAFVGARGDAQQATQELGQRDMELAQARSEAQQALALARQDPRVPALEQARQQLEVRNQELTSQIAALAEERDELKGTVQFLEHGRLRDRSANAALAGVPAAPGEAAPAVPSVPSVLSVPTGPMLEGAVQEPSPATEGAPGAPDQTTPSAAPETIRDSSPEFDPALRAENSNLKSQVQSLEADLSRLDAENTALKGAQQTLPGLEARAAELRAQVSSLEQREAGLRAVIATLEEDRKALAVQAKYMFPLCSGSMEPKITCLDTVVLLENFRPQDIEVGTVISFIPPPEEGEDAETLAPVLHRVADIKREDGIYHYWPKGDAWTEPDGYWVPDTSVVGYVIELLPGTRPENAALRELVNRTRESYAAARDKMVAARNRYDETAIANCGSVEAVASCQATEEGFSQVAGAYTQFTQAWNAYVSAVCEYDKAYFHGLNESQPNENKELTPYVAPAQCSG